MYQSNTGLQGKDSGYESLKYQILQEVAENDDISDEQLLSQIDEIICRESVKGHYSLKEKIQYRKDIFHSIRGLDVIQSLLEDDSAQMKDL